MPKAWKLVASLKSPACLHETLTLVERRRAILALLELEGSDTSKARHLLEVSEELQRKIWADKEQLEQDFEELKKQGGG
jgi:hypothetical protein